MLPVFFAASDKRVSVRKSPSQHRLGLLECVFAFFQRVIVERNPSLAVWALRNELPPGRRRDSRHTDYDTGDERRY
jgi:hypothetical protein